MPQITVMKWREFQHYKRRRAPWVKLYGTLLDDPDFQNLPADELKHLVNLWLLASRTLDGCLQDASNTLAWRLRMFGAPGLSEFLRLTQLLAARKDEKGEPKWITVTFAPGELGLCPIASNMLATCEQVSTPETETETETEPEKTAPLASLGGPGGPKKKEPVAQSAPELPALPGFDSPGSPPSSNGNGKPAKRPKLAAPGPKVEGVSAGFPNWVAEAAAILLDLGAFAHGEIGTRLTPLVARFGWPNVRDGLRAMVRFGPGEPERARFLTPYGFARDWGYWRDFDKPLYPAGVHS